MACSYFATHVVQGTELLGCQAVQPVATVCPAPDQSHLAEDPKVL